MSFNYEPVTYGEIKDNKGTDLKVGSQQYNMLQLATPQDHCIADVLVKHLGKTSCFTDIIVWDNEVPCTLTSKGNIFSGNSKKRFSIHDITSMQTFPEDYDFNGNPVRYICGMSVPPVMIKRIVTRLIESGVFAHSFTEK